MKKKINILFICSSANTGGAEKNILLIHNLVLKKRINSKIIFLRKTNKKKINFNKRKNFIFFNSKKIIFSLFKLLNYINKNNPDVVYSTTYSVNLICIIVKILSYKNFFLITRESNNIFKKKFYSNFYEKILLKFVFLYNFSDRIIAPSHTIFSQLKKIVLKKNKVLLINNIIEFINDKKLLNSDKILIEKIKKDKKKIVLSIGRLEHQKNFIYLLRSFIFLKKKKISLIIIGNGKLKNHLDLFIKKNNLKNVYMLGERSNLSLFYKRSDLYVQTSLYEGMPNCILEAAYYQKKILIRRYDGVLSDFRKYGLRIHTTNTSEKKFSKEIENSINSINQKKFFIINKQKIITNNMKSKEDYKHVFTYNYLNKFYEQ
jgi:glycosyltransferase involved in cell wall biosynthesis